MEPASTRTDSASDLLAFLKHVQEDYRDTRALFNDIQQRFSLRESEVQRLRKLLAPVVSASPRIPSTVHPASGIADRDRHVLEVHLLGSFCAFVDGCPVTDWRSGRSKALFKYLLNHRQRHIPREQLMEALWPEGDPHASINSLRVAVHNLRQVVADCGQHSGRGAFILFEDGTYRWSSRVDFWVDVEEFERHWQAGRRLEMEGDLHAAMRQFEAAESLYAGDFLEDDPYEEWTLLRREGLKDTHLIIVTKLAEQCFKRADYEGCMLRCQRILQSDPCRDDAYQRLIRCCAQLGQRGRARSWFEICVRILRQELDLAPSQETVDLYRGLLSGSDRLTRD